MKYVLAVLLTSAVATVALAQDGTAHGPPKAPIIVTVPTLPGTSVPTTGGSLSSLFQPKAELSAMLR
jgi:hypothetical protein